MHFPLIKNQAAIKLPKQPKKKRPETQRLSNNDGMNCPPVWIGVSNQMIINLSKNLTLLMLSLF